MSGEYCFCGGTVFDPQKGFVKNDRTYVANGRIVSADSAHGLNPSMIDLSDCILMPSLVDFHTHIYSPKSLLSVPADLLASHGIVSLCDAGTCGTDDFEDFLQTTFSSSALQLKAFLNIGSRGQIGDGINEDVSPENIDVHQIKTLFTKYSDIILGLKLRFSENIVPKNRAEEVLDFAVNLSRSLNTRLCIHVTDSPLPLSLIAEKLSCGDIICHCFHGKEENILKSGKIPVSVWDAKKRGVIFDAANGFSNFCTKTAKNCIQSGFYPDILSTDMFEGIFHKYPYIQGLPMLMTKYLALGLPMEDVFRAVTVTPAAIMNIPCSIEPESSANLTILRKNSGSVIFKDIFEQEIRTDYYLSAVLSMKNGNILSCDPHFAQTQ